MQWNTVKSDLKKYICSITTKINVTFLILRHTQHAHSNIYLVRKRGNELVYYLYQSFFFPHATKAHAPIPNRIFPSRPYHVPRANGYLYRFDGSPLSSHSKYPLER